MSAISPYCLQHAIDQEWIPATPPPTNAEIIALLIRARANTACDELDLDLRNMIYRLKPRTTTARNRNVKALIADR
jgi:hypothetical protein